MKRRYCAGCDDCSNANPCAACGAPTEPWPCDGSETDVFYQNQPTHRERVEHERETQARIMRELKR